MSRNIKIENGAFIDYSGVAYTNGAWNINAKDQLYMKYEDFDANTVYSGYRYAGPVPLNFPPGSYGHLLAFGYNYTNGNFQVTQFATDQNGTGLWFRKGMNGEWNPWHKVSLEY